MNEMKFGRLINDIIKCDNETGRLLPEEQSPRTSVRPSRHKLLVDIYLSIFLSDCYILEVAGRRRRCRPPLVGTGVRDATTESRVASQSACSRCWLETWVAHTSAPESFFYLCDRDLERWCGKKKNRIANVEYTDERGTTDKRK